MHRYIYFQSFTAGPTAGIFVRNGETVISPLSSLSTARTIDDRYILNAVVQTKESIGPATPRMGGKKESEGIYPKSTEQSKQKQENEGATHAVRILEEQSAYDRSHEDLVAAFRGFVQEQQQRFIKAGAPVDTPEGFIREKLETETRTWGMRWEDHKSEFWVPILTAWDALTYHRHRTGSEHEQEAGYQLWEHYQQTHQPVVRLFHPVQIRVIDALTEAIGIEHTRGQTDIPIPEKIRTITDYNA